MRAAGPVCVYIYIYTHIHYIQTVVRSKQFSFFSESCYFVVFLIVDVFVFKKTCFHGTISDKMSLEHLAQEQLFFPLYGTTCLNQAMALA